MQPCTADLAVSEDQFIVAQRVTQAGTDNASLQPTVEEVQQQCHAKPVVRRDLADAK